MRYALFILIGMTLLSAPLLRAADSNGSLIGAAAFGSIDEIKKALADGADINYRDPKNQGRTPLIMAVLTGSTEKIAFLLAQKADANIRADGGMTALMYVPQMNTFEQQVMVEAARILLVAKAQINAANADGDTALMTAVRSGAAVLASYLVSRGADVSAKNGRGRTALMDARVNENEVIVKMLRTAGAADIPNPDDELYLALVHDDAAAAARAIKAGARVSGTEYAYLHLACQRGLAPMVTMLLDAKADVNTRNESGETALMAAISRKSVEIAATLVERGADVNARSKGGYTPLIMAAQAMSDEKEHLALVDLLFKAKARPDERGDKGMTALMWAAGQGLPGITRRILEAGTDVNAADDNGMTALMFAANFQRRDSIEALIKAGARVTARDANGWTPIFHAIKGAFEAEMVMVLIKAGAGVNAKAKGGWTPLMEAAAKGKPDIVKALLAAGADVNAHSDEGNTALRYASMMDMVNIPDSPFRLVVELLKGAGAR